MAIRWDKFTVKAQEAVQRAGELASEYANPEVLSPFLANAVHVSVVANGESHVTVNRIRAGK